MTEFIISRLSLDLFVLYQSVSVKMPIKSFTSNAVPEICPNMLSSFSLANLGLPGDIAQMYQDDWQTILYLLFFPTLDTVRVSKALHFPQTCSAI